MGQHDVFGDGQSQPRAAGFAGAGLVYPVESAQTGEAGVRKECRDRNPGHRIRRLRRRAALPEQSAPRNGRISAHCPPGSRKPDGWPRDRLPPGRKRGLRLSIRHFVPARFRESSARLPAAGRPARLGWMSNRCSPDSTRARVSRSSVRRDMRTALLRMISRKSRE